VEKQNKKLGERLEKFFERVLKLVKRCPKNPVTERIIKQLVASAGSVPANYYEGQYGLSRKDCSKAFRISRKEAKESGVWLRGLKTAVGSTDPEFDALVKEAQEIVFILSSVIEKITRK